MDLFLRATRKKFRFESAKGLLSVEDLWDLPLKGEVSLDTIARNLYKEIKEKEEISFVDEISQDSEAKEKLEVIKTIIQVKLDEKKEAEKREEIRSKKEKLLRILQKKEEEELLQKDKEEIKKMLDELYKTETKK